MRFSLGFAAALLVTHSSSPAQAQTVAIDACSFFQSAQEAQAVFERDPSHYRFLDANRNGLACETLPNVVRSDGTRVSSGSTSQGWRYEIWRSSVDFVYDAGDSFDVFYVRAWRQTNPETVLTTGNFDSQQQAYYYFRDYLQ